METEGDQPSKVLIQEVLRLADRHRQVRSFFIKALFTELAVFLSFIAMRIGQAIFSSGPLHMFYESPWFQLLLLLMVFTFSLSWMSQRYLASRIRELAQHVREKDKKDS